MQIKKLCRFLLLPLVLAVVACQPKNFNEPGEIKQPKKKTGLIFRANFDKTWNAVNEVAKDLPVIVRKKDSGVIMTDWIKTKSDRLYSGFDENRIPYTIRYKFTIKVKPTSKGTMVDVENQEQYFTDSVTSGIDFSGSIYQWLDTESSTLKEAAFLEKVGDELFPKKD